MLALEKPTANQRTTIEFRKTRVPIGVSGAGRSASKGVATGIKFQVKPAGRGAGLASVRGREGGGGGGGGGGDETEYEDEEYDADMENSAVARGPGTFITETEGASAAAKR
jgi:hypothetical protein